MFRQNAMPPIVEDQGRAPTSVPKSVVSARAGITPRWQSRASACAGGGVAAATGTADRAGAARQTAGGDRRAEGCRRNFIARTRSIISRSVSNDGEVVEHKITALKCDVGRIDVDLPDDRRRRIADRDLARTDLAATKQATSILRADLAEVSAAAGDVAKSVEALLCAVLNTQAEGIAVRHQALMQQVGCCVRALAASPDVVGPACRPYTASREGGRHPPTGGDGRAA
jgi:hypothetical protein